MKGICARCRGEIFSWELERAKLEIGDQTVGAFLLCEQCAQTVMRNFNLEVLGE